MAANTWRTGTGIRSHLYQDCQQFEFAQAVRLLCEGVTQNVEESYLDQVLHFSSHPGSEFPGSELFSIKRDVHRRHVLTISFFGLLGQHSPLPEPYQQWVRHELAQGNSSLFAFLTIFNHRLIKLLYKILSKNRPSLDAADPEHSNQGKMLNALMGFAQTEQRAQLPLPLRAYQAYAGLLSHRRLTPARITQFLRAYFNCSVWLQQFVGEWCDLDAHQCTYLHHASSAAPAKKSLGRDATLGCRVWQQDAGIAVYVGPLSWSSYQASLPNGGNYRDIAQTILDVTRRRWRVKLYLLLDEREAPKSALAASVSNTPLGQASWLHSYGELSAQHHWLEKLPQKIRAKLPAKLIGTCLDIVPAHWEN